MAQTLLRARGLEDQWFTGTPERTYFETKSEPRVNRSRESFELPFDNQPTYGQTGRCIIHPKGDFLTGLTFRTILPAIYPTIPGQYVYPKPSSQVGATVYVEKDLTLVVADGTTLTANTAGNHYFSVGAQVTLSGTSYVIFDLDGTYTITSIPTANSFTCSTTVSGISYNGSVAISGIQCADIVSYFSTQNSNLWLNNVTNKTWQITGALVVGSQTKFTTSEPSNFPVGSQVLVNLPSSGVVNQVFTVTASTDTSCNITSSSALTLSASDSVSFVTPPFVVINTFQFQSTIYPRISFANTDDAAFWGFDARQGLTYSLPVTPPWTLTQSGWITGFLPPSTSTYVDSVAHKLVKFGRILVGKQTIKEFTGEYIELQNDLWVPYENKAILKLLNGTLDQTQSVAAREYYVRIPLGTHEYPLCALTQQHLSVEVDFEQYSALSDNLNSGSGQFTDPASYTTYTFPGLNVLSTFSYQQYIFIVADDGRLIIYDTTKSFTDPGSYQIITALAGSSSLFSQFCVLSGTLYIGLTNGQLIRGNLNELIQGNTSSFVLDNYVSTYGQLTGTLVADFRYVYYAVSNTINSNVFVTQYDTVTASHKSVDFTKTFNSGVNGVYQFMSTGSQLIMVPKGIVSGNLYTFQFNANVQSQWYTLSIGSQVRETCLIGNKIYLATTTNLLMLYNSIVTTGKAGQFSNLMVTGNDIYCFNGTAAVRVDTSKNIALDSSYQTSPLPGTLFAHGPRYVYMFSSGVIYRYDPYAPDTTFKASLIADYESSSVKPDKAILPIIQTKHVTDMANLKLKGPVKELWFTGEPGSNVFQYSNLATQSTLSFNGEGIVSPDVGTQTFLNVIQPFETHTSMPIRNVSVVPFEFDPESETPNGTINFSRIRDQEFTGNAASVWSRSINILKIQGGIGGLIFDS